MKKYEGVGIDARLSEIPGKNQYVVNFGDRPADDPASVVEVDVDTLTYQVTRSHVAMVKQDELRGLTKEHLLKAAEIEMNTIPGLPMYVLIPDAHPMAETMAMPT